MDYPSSELAAMDGANNYHGWILREFRPFLGHRVVEVGAGLGSFASHLLTTGPEILVLLEPARNLFPRLVERLGERPNVTLIPLQLHEAEAELRTMELETAVLVNVLEHVPEDVAVLRMLHSLLGRQGSLLLLVPALPWLFGTLDVAFGHERRYTLTELADKVTRAGFRVERLAYRNLPGVAAWFLAGKVLRRATLSPRSVAAYDRLVIPWLSRLEQIIPPPLGQSLLAIATKP